MGLSALLGSKLTLGNAVGIALEAGESVVKELVCIEMLGLSELLGSKLTVGVVVRVCLGIDRIVGDCV